MTETTREYDPVELLNGSVESVVVKFPELNRADIVRLHEIEEGGQKRTTMLAAIDRELKTRDEAAPAGQAGPAQAPGEAGETISLVEHQRLMEEKDKAHAETVEKLTGELASKAAKAPKAPNAKKLELPAKGEAPNEVALTGGTRVVFVDAEDMTLPRLAAFPFAAADFAAAGTGAKLMKAIDFPTHAPGAEIGGAFLFGEDGKTPVGKATLVMPFRVGGGRSARMAPGTLVFERPALEDKVAA